jgi:hypothetical protein
LNREFSKENIQMVSEHMKRTITGELQTKHYDTVLHIIKMAVTKTNQKTTNAGKKKGEPLYIAGGNVKNALAVFKS